MLETNEFLNMMIMQNIIRSDFMVHGPAHAARTALFSMLLARFSSECFPQGPRLNADEMECLKGAALMHDSGRLADLCEDRPEWEKQSAKNLDLLVDENRKQHFIISSQMIEMMRSAIVKQDVKASVSQLFNGLEKMIMYVHDADAIEIQRLESFKKCGLVTGTNPFDASRLFLYRCLESQKNQAGLLAFTQLIEEFNLIIQTTSSPEFNSIDAYGKMCQYIEENKFRFPFTTTLFNNLPVMSKESPLNRLAGIIRQSKAIFEQSMFEPCCALTGIFIRLVPSTKESMNIELQKCSESCGNLNRSATLLIPGKTKLLKLNGYNSGLVIGNLKTNQIVCAARVDINSGFGSKRAITESYQQARSGLDGVRELYRLLSSPIEIGGGSTTRFDNNEVIINYNLAQNVIGFVVRTSEEMEIEILRMIRLNKELIDKYQKAPVPIYIFPCMHELVINDSVIIRLWRSVITKSMSQLVETGECLGQTALSNVYNGDDLILSYKEPLKGQILREIGIEYEKYRGFLTEKAVLALTSGGDIWNTPALLLNASESVLASYGKEIIAQMDEHLKKINGDDKRFDRYLDTLCRLQECGKLTTIFNSSQLEYIKELLDAKLKKAVNVPAYGEVSVNIKHPNFNKLVLCCIKLKLQSATVFGLQSWVEERRYMPALLNGNFEEVSKLIRDLGMSKAFVEKQFIPDVISVIETQRQKWGRHCDSQNVTNLITDVLSGIPSGTDKTQLNLCFARLMEGFYFDASTTMQNPRKYRELLGFLSQTFKEPLMERVLHSMIIKNIRCSIDDAVRQVSLLDKDEDGDDTPNHLKCIYSSIHSMLNLYKKYLPGKQFTAPQVEAIRRAFVPHMEEIRGKISESSVDGLYLLIRFHKKYAFLGETQKESEIPFENEIKARLSVLGRQGQLRNIPPDVKETFDWYLGRGRQSPPLSPMQISPRSSPSLPPTDFRSIAFQGLTPAAVTKVTPSSPMCVTASSRPPSSMEEEICPYYM